MGPVTQTPVSTARLRWLGAALITIALGLASRKFPQALPAVLGKYPGDALWALMIYCLLGALNPGARLRLRAGWSLLICFAVEFAQLYQAPWIQSIRSTTLGLLVLGSHFHSLDLLAYATGIIAAVVLEGLSSSPGRRES